MRGARYRVICFAAILAALWSTTGWSAESVPSGYRSIAAEFGIPQTILYAIALTESAHARNGHGNAIHPWPWTLNVAGRAYYYPSRLAAWEALKVFLARGERSIDIGLMQVNWRYHQDKLGNPWQALDPYHNVRMAADILQRCFEQRRDWWASVGCYHAPANARRAQRYRSRVIGHWQRLVNDG